MKTASTELLKAARQSPITKSIAYCGLRSTTKVILHRAQTRILPEIRQAEIKRNILLNPGPATTTDAVKRSLVVPDICHREKEFCDLSTDVHRRLAEVVHGGSGYAAVTFAGSGTAAVEAVIGSVVPHDRKLLIIENGAYGKRMRQMAEALGIGTIVIKSPWEETPAIEAIEEAFENHQGAISHLAVVHHETTTGLLNPVRRCGEISKRFGADVIVDAMSSYAGIPIDIREWKVDYLVSLRKQMSSGHGGNFVCHLQPGRR